jgi:large conductance mechanosensitive channel
VLAYGAFSNTVVEFLIIAFVLFLVIRQVNRLRHPAPEAPKEPPAEQKLLGEICDILKSQQRLVQP